MKKFNMIMLVAIVALVGIPVVSALEITKYGAVTDYTPNGKHTANYKAPTIVADANNEVTTIDITEGELEVIDKTADPKIPENYDDSTLFGISVKKPEPDTGLDNACWVRPGEEDCRADKDATVDANDGTGRTLWISFKAEELKEAIENGGKEAVIVKTIKLKWGGKSDGKGIQTIVVRLHAGNVTLKNDPNTESLIAEGSEFTVADREAAIAKYEENQRTPVETTKEPAEKNADTADINLGLLLSILAISTLGLGYTFKKRFN